MKIFFAILIVLAAAMGVYYWNNDRTPQEQQGVYSGSDLPFTFEYRKSPDGYIVREMDSDGSIPNLVKTVTVMQESDYQSIQSGERAGGEAPPAIIIQVYENAGNLTPAQWIEEYPQLSNWTIRTSVVRATSVGGRDAITYETDGLYPNRNVVLSDGNRIYFVNGSYLERDSALYRDFPTLLASIKFK